jgi:ribulose-phosphate 3-epimerase
MKISPSIMCADLLRLGEDLAAVEAAGADTIHVDVMDGHLVPGFTFSADFVRAMRGATKLPLDVHLMSSAPERHIDQFLEAGASSLTIQVESAPDPFRLLEIVRKSGVRAGLALSPGTPLFALTEYLDVVDEILVMAVCPGFVGQAHIGRCRTKAAEIVSWLSETGRTAEVVLDGGVKAGDLQAIAALGISKVVSGSGVFSTGLGPYKQIIVMKDILRTATAENTLAAE